MASVGYRSRMTESTPENTHESLYAHEIGRAAIDDAIDESIHTGTNTG